MKYYPETLKEYPKYIVGYWLMISIALIFVHIVYMLPYITESGMFVEKKVCLETAPAGRYDEQEECVEYGKSNYVPAGKEIKDIFLYTTRNVGITVLAVGLFLMYGKYKEEKKHKEIKG